MRGVALAALAQSARRPISGIPVAGTGLELFREAGISVPSEMPVSTDIKRLKLSATGFVPVAGTSDPRTAYDGAAYRGNIIQPAATYQVALPTDNASAPNTSSDPIYFTKSVAEDTIEYPGGHSAASIFQGTGKGVRFTRSGTEINQYRATNGLLSGLTAGQVVRHGVVLAIETIVEGAIALRAYGGLTTAVEFTHDDSGLVTGEDSVWSSQRAGFYNYPFLINGKQWVYCWVDRVATGTDSIDFGIDIVAGDGATALHVVSFTAQIDPADWPCAVPVTQAGTYAEDEVESGILSQIGFILHGVGVCRSRAPSGVISSPAFQVGGEYLPICTRIDVVDTTACLNDRSGFMDSTALPYAQRPWQSPAEFSINYGPIRLQRQFVDIDSSNDTCTDAAVRGVFAGRYDLYPELGNTATSANFLLGNLTIESVNLLVQGDPTIKTWYEQNDIRGNGTSKQFFVNQDVLLRDVTFIGATNIATRAPWQYQNDWGSGRVWVGEVRIASNGGRITIDDVRTHRLARLTLAGISTTSEIAITINNFCSSEAWMDCLLFGGMILTELNRSNILLLPQSAYIDGNRIQSEWPIEVTNDGGETWAAIDLEVNPIPTLPHGIYAEKVGTRDLDTGVITSDPDATQLLPVRYYGPPPANGPVGDKIISVPGYEYIITEIDLGSYSRSPISGEVFVWLDPDSDFGMRFTAQSGVYRETSGYVRGPEGVVPVNGRISSTDGMQFNKTNCVAVGAVGSYDAENLVVFNVGTAEFQAGTSFIDGLPREDGSRYNNFRVTNMVAVLGGKRDILGFDNSGEPDSVYSITNLLAMEGAGKVTFPAGGDLQLSIGVAGSYNTLDLTNATILSGRANPVAIQGGATVTGDPVTVIQTKTRSNFDQFSALPEDSKVPDYIPADFYDEVQGRVILPTATQVLDGTFRFPAIIETDTGVDYNAVLDAAIGDHAKREPMLRAIETRYHELPVARANILWTTAIGTVLATGVNGHLNHPRSGNGVDRLYEIVGGELRLAKAPPEEERIDLILTSTGQLYQIDITAPDAVAPVIEAFAVTGTPTNGQTLSFTYTISASAFPAPTNTITVFLDDPENSGELIEVAEVTGDADSASYVIDAGILDVAEGDVITLQLKSSNSAGEAVATLSVEYEAPIVGDLTAEEQDLIALIDAGGGSSLYARLNEAQLLAGNLVVDDLSALGNDLEQASASNQPPIDIVNGATFESNDYLILPISGGTYTVVMSFTKDDANASGTMVSDQAAASNVQYNSGSGNAIAATITVNGASVTATRSALYAAIHALGERIITFAGIDATGDTELRIGRASGSMVGVLRRVAVLDHAALGSNLSAATALAQTAVGQS